MPERDSSSGLGLTCFSSSLFRVHVYIKDWVIVDDLRHPELRCGGQKNVPFAYSLLVTAFGSPPQARMPLSARLVFHRNH